MIVPAYRNTRRSDFNFSTVIFLNFKLVLSFTHSTDVDYQHIDTFDQDSSKCITVNNKQKKQYYLKPFISKPFVGKH